MQKVSRSFHPPKQRIGLDLSAWIPILFLVFVFLLGGGSRSDVASLPLLRGVSVLVAFWAITGMNREDWHRVRVPLILMITLVLWIGVQLVPLPPFMWHGLPGRETIVAIDRILGQAEIWRPISLTPSRTLNSLLAMSVPVATLLIGSRLTIVDFKNVMVTFVAIAVASAFLGFIQIMSGSGGAAYFYRITNADSIVGLFANRNHHAIFLACATMIAAMLLRDEFMRKHQNRIFQVGLVFAALLLTITTSFIGSRAGLVAGIAVFGLAYVMIASSWSERSGGGQGVRSGNLGGRVRKILIYSPPILLAMLLGTALLISSRISGLTRLAGQSLADDMRVQAWPVVTEMIKNYWIAGSGFGSFSTVYRMFEPDSLLQPAYFNHAHNDWAEAAITGGLPFVLILATAILWFGRNVLKKGMRNLIKGHRGDYRLTVLVVVAVLSAASLVDYPLRVPSLQMLTILSIIALCCPAPARRTRD